MLLISISTLVIKGCKKDEVPAENALYDLFPLKPGNIFYYSYSYSFQQDPVFGPVKNAGGKRQWRILTASSEINSVEYTFEEKYNGFEKTTIIYPDIVTDSINIIDSIRYFKVIEDENGQLSFLNLNPTWNITLQRFQKDSDIVIHNWAGGNYRRDYQFHANKGLINWTNGKGPITGMYLENYTLDSVMPVDK